MKLSKIILTICLLMGSSTINSCEKYLDAKPDKRLGIPSGLVDYQALLDSYGKINFRGVSSIVCSADDYYLTDKDWASLSDFNKNLYLWKHENIFQPQYNEWSDIYTIVYYANTALNNIPKIKRSVSNASVWDNAMGQGYFLRANAFFQIALAWSQAYDKNTAETDLGIPLRLTTDFNEPSKRSTLQQTYDQIISDLKKSISRLPISTEHPMRPGKPAAYGLLARVYLSMRDYQHAFLYSDSCLRIRKSLMDYNEIDPTPKYPIPSYNIEDLFDEHCNIISSKLKADSAAYAIYANNDLRKDLFFKDNGDGSHSFRGSYAQSLAPFMGVATDEVYLMRAECEARFGKVDQAMEDLNALLITRWKVGTFIPYTATDKEDALHQILTERRKELFMRPLRWMDVKRLNKEGYNITMKRYTNGMTYALEPNSQGYALPIPEDIIELTGMSQNPE